MEITRNQGLELVKENNIKSEILESTSFKETLSAENEQYQIWMDKFKFSEEQAYSYTVTIWDKINSLSLMDLDNATQTDFYDFKNATA